MMLAESASSIDGWLTAVSILVGFAVMIGSWIYRGGQIVNEIKHVKDEVAGVRTELYNIKNEVGRVRDNLHETRAQVARIDATSAAMAARVGNLEAGGKGAV